MSLKYFQFVAMYRNFSRAAEHFYIGQPALSRQIASLEKELGVQLFDRNTRNVALTEAGRVLYDHCDLLMRHHELIYRLMDAAKSGYDGQLSIAAVADFSTLFADLIEAFIEAFPRVKTRIDDVPFTQLTDSIAHGVYDLAFTLDYAVPANDQIAVTVIGHDHFVAVMGKSFAPDLGDTVTTRELLHHTLVVPSHVDPPFLRGLRLAALEQGRAGAGGLDVVPNTTTAKLRVLLGLGVALMPSATVSSFFDASRFRLCELVDLDTTCAMVLIRRRDNTQRTLQNFMDLIRDRRTRTPPPL